MRVSILSSCQICCLIGWVNNVKNQRFKVWSCCCLTACVEKRRNYRFIISVMYVYVVSSICTLSTTVQQERFHWGFHLDAITLRRGNSRSGSYGLSLSFSIVLPGDILHAFKVTRSWLTTLRRSCYGKTFLGVIKWLRGIWRQSVYYKAEQTWLRPGLDGALLQTWNGNRGWSTDWSAYSTYTITSKTYRAHWRSIRSVPENILLRNTAAAGWGLLQGGGTRQRRTRTGWPGRQRHPGTGCWPGLKLQGDEMMGGSIGGGSIVGLPCLLYSHAVRPTHWPTVSGVFSMSVR